MRLLGTAKWRSASSFFFIVLCLLTLQAHSAAYAAPTVEPAGTYFEAENFSGSIIQGSAYYQVESGQSGFNGAGYLKAYGSSYSNPPTGEGKEYRLYFPEAGTYHFWVRAMAFNGSSDSVYIGLDGQTVGALAPAVGGWVWSNSTYRGSNQLSIPAPGEYTVNVYIREGEFLLDGIYLTKGTETPTGSTPSWAAVVDPSHSPTTNPTKLYFEAENFSGTIIQGSAYYQFESEQSGFNGGGYLKAYGSSYSNPPAGEGKEYRFNFPEAGTYHFWVRAMAFDSYSDSIYIGLNGQTVGALRPPLGGWVWSKDTYLGANQINIPSPGEHTVNIFIREGEFLLDGIYLTKGTEIPSGSIPADATIIDPSLAGSGDDTTPPSLAITSPTEGALVSGATSVTVDTSDPSGIDRVELLLDGLLIATDSEAPYEFSWTPPSKSGTYQLTARSYDTELNWAEKSIELTVPESTSQVPTMDPTGTYIEAENFSGSIIQGAAYYQVESGQSGFNGLGYIKAYGSSYSNPPAGEGKEYRLYFPEAGTYHFWVRAMAFNGSSDSVYIGLNGQAVGALAPSIGGWVWSKGTYLGTNQLSIPAPGEYTVNVFIREGNLLLDGIYLTKGAETPEGTIPSWAAIIDPSGVIALPDTLDPLVAFASPQDGGNVSGTVAVDITASDDTNVTRVDLLVDGILVATDTSAPFSFNWNAPEQTGTYQLIAKAFDSAQNSGTASISVKVTETSAFNDTTVNYDLHLPVTLTVANTDEAPRVQEPVTSGVPLPKSAGVIDPGQLILRAENGEIVPAQFQVRSRWHGPVADETRPIKWLLVDFQADVPFGTSAIYTLEKSENPVSSEKAISITEGAGSIEVDTGRARFEISRSHFNLFDRVWATDSSGGEMLLVNQAGQGGVTLVDKNGKIFDSISAAPEEIVIEEQGPLRSVIKIRGNLQAADGSWFAPSVNKTAEYPRFSQPYANSFVYYNCRIHFYADKDYVKVFFTLENNGANGRSNPEPYFAPVQMVYFDSVSLNLGLDNLGAGQLSSEGLEIPMNEQDQVSLYQDWQDYTANTSYGTRESTFADGPFFNLEKNGGLIQSGATHPGEMEYSGSSAGISFAMRHFWQNYPKNLEMSPTQLQIGLWPEGGYYPNCNSTDFPNDPEYCAEAGQDAGIYILDGGRHKTFEMVLGFHADASSSTTNEAHTMLNKPLMALAPAGWFVDSGALGMLAPPGMSSADPEIDEAMQRFEKLQLSLVDAQYAENSFTINNLKTVTPAYWNYNRQDRYFGWMNFGDLLWAGKVPSALHYDWPYNMLLHYVRTGQYELFENGVEMTRHRYDIDQYHGDRKDTNGNHVFINHMAFYESDGHADPTLASYPSYVSKHSHTWNGGLVLYYLLTGDRKAWETAVENGQAALTTYGQKADVEGCAKSELRMETWPMLNLLNLYRVNGDPEYYRVAKNIALNRLLYREQQAGGIGHFGRGDGCANIDPGQQESTMYAYTVAPVIQAHYETQDPELGNMILRMADFTWTRFLVGGDYDGQGMYRPLQSSYFWKEGHTGGEPVKNVFWADLFAYAYRLSEDAQYLDWARQTFRDAMFYYTAPERSYISPSLRSRISFLDGKFAGSETKVHGWIGRTNQIYLSTEYSLIR